MADCFSLPNAAELVEDLRRHIKLAHEGRIYVDIGSEFYCKHAADAIEQLLAENAKLKAERDAAVADIKMNWLCAVCKKRVIAREWMRCENKNFYEAPCEAPTCLNFEWRGVPDTDAREMDGGAR